MLVWCWCGTTAVVVQYYCSMLLVCYTKYCPETVSAVCYQGGTTLVLLIPYCKGCATIMLPYYPTPGTSILARTRVLTPVETYTWYTANVILLLIFKY